ncbi:autophagy protein 12-like [Oppia nitens]|uniref:autophagy protein 12-like n=1 Tax=Oppia nitens TaxID=1686743 RepID=UPI0023DB1C69|nr:autophagy protein 12-like [Oppia nitens]
MADQQSDSQDNDNIVKTATVDDKANDDKVEVLLRSAGDAPIMKKKNWKVDSNRTIGWISDFIRKYIRIENNESLFLYVNQTFSPSPDQTVRNLLECFGSDGKLVLYYAKTQAWG